LSTLAVDRLGGQRVTAQNLLKCGNNKHNKVFKAFKAFNTLRTVWQMTLVTLQNMAL
jgi:hypothetical protein